MLAVVLSLLCVLIFVIGCSFVRRMDTAWRKLFNPLVLLGGSTILYTLTPWLAEPSGDDPVMQSFMLMQLVAFCGMVTGAVSAHQLFPVTTTDVSFVAIPKQSEKVIVSAQIFGVGLFLLAYNFFLGGLENIVMFGYSNITRAESEGGVLIFIQLVLIQYALPAVLVTAYLTGVKRVLFYFCASVYLLLLLASGTRNFLVMFVGNFVLIHSIIWRRLDYLRISVIAGTLLLFLTAIGLYRNFGLDGRAELFALISDVGMKTMNPSSQELGTSFNVYQIHSSHPEWFSLSPGESYLNAVCAIVPTFVWPSRPASVSTIFSTYFAMPGEGLGFSNNLEAYLNGGLVGVFLVNATLLFVSVVMYNKKVAGKVTILGLAFYGNLVFVAFNWNRIDFQTVLKISMIRIGLFYFVASLLMSIVNTSHRRSSVNKRWSKKLANSPFNKPNSNG